MLAVIYKFSVIVTATNLTAGVRGVSGAHDWLPCGFPRW